MSTTEDDVQLTNHYRREVAHWSLLVTILASFFIADQLYYFLDLILPEVVESVDSVIEECSTSCEQICT
jgi:hypothetical protein